MIFLPESYNKLFNSILNYPEFLTHSNYVKCLKNLSEKVVFDCEYSVDKLKFGKSLRIKIKLINLTHGNIIEEYKKISSFREYSVICSSWIPVKSYYLIFNLLLVLNYLLTNDEICLKKRHWELLADFKKLLKSKKAKFNKVFFNFCIGANKILSWQIPKSENLKRVNIDRIKRVKQILKILYRYSKEDYKSRKNIKRLSGKKLIDFNNNSSISLFDFFYWYRIKANYRDMEFIDEGVPVEDFFIFYKNYFLLTINFYSALMGQINKMAVDKIGSKIL